MTTLSAIQRGALGLATTDSPTFNGLSIDTTAGVDGQWNTSGLAVYANGVTPQHDALLHVMSGSAGTVTANTQADDVVFEASGANNGMSFLHPATGNYYMLWGSPTSNQLCQIGYDEPLNTLEISAIKASSLIFMKAGNTKNFELSSTGLSLFASGVTPQHDGLLHVMSGSAGTVTASSSGDEIVVEGNGQTGISLLAPDNSSTRIYFGGPTGTNTAAQLLWDYNAGSPVFNFGTLTGASSLINFYAGATTQVGQWNTTGLTVFASGVTPQHDGPLHVMSGSAGTVTAGNSYDELVVEGSGNTGMSILAPDASQVGFTFGSPTNKTGAELNWTYNSLAYNIATNVANATINFYPDNYSHRGQWNTTGLTVFASGVTPQHDGVLHVMGGSAGAVTASVSGDELVLENSSQAGLSILCPDANNGQIYFGNPAGNTAAYIQWLKSVNTLRLGTIYHSGSSVEIYSGAGTLALTLTSTQTMVAATTYSTTVGATNRDLYIDNTGLIGYVSSLQAAKTEIQPITDTSWLHSLNPVSFKYRKKNEAGQYTDETDGDIQYGMVAEEVEAVRPDLCFYDDVADLDENGEKTETTHKELRGIQYSKLVPVLLKEVQKLRAELNQMKAN